MTGRPNVGPLDLTDRQAEVLALLGAGLAMRAIAERMQISVLTARGHLKTAMQRLDATNSTHAVALATARGLLPLTAGGK